MTNPSSLEPTIRTLTVKHFIGKRLTMSFAHDHTAELWRSFMPRRGEIEGVVGSELYSVEVYGPGFFDKFNPTREFEKWAAVEVSEHCSVPPGMDAITVPGGLYAVFLYRGAAGAAKGTFRYIFTTWLPNSAYAVDLRPHFAVMGDKYRREHPESEEELWIPIRTK